MHDILLSVLGAEPISPDSVVSMPVSVMWGGIVTFGSATVVLVLSLLTVAHRIGSFETSIKDQFKAVGLRIDGHDKLLETAEKRAQVHSDDIGVHETAIAVLQAGTGIAAKG